MSAELHFPGLVRSAGEVSARGARLAGGLLRLGLREGDVLAVLTRNDPVVCDVVLACRTAGVYYCPINWHFTPEEARFIIEDSGAKALLVSADLLTPLAPCLSNALPLLVCNLPDDHTQMQVETASQRMQAYDAECMVKNGRHDGDYRRFSELYYQNCDPWWNQQARASQIVCLQHLLSSLHIPYLFYNAEDAIDPDDTVQQALLDRTRFFEPWTSATQILGKSFAIGQCSHFDHDATQHLAELFREFIMSSTAYAA